MNINERLALTIVAVILAFVTSIYISRNSTRRLPLLSFTTPLLTLALLYYYHQYVSNPSHGIAIWILPLATGWLWWRREHTGKPALSNLAFAGLQVAYSLLYVAVVNLQGL